MRKRIPTFRIEWRGIRLVIRHQIDYLWPGQSHIEIDVVHPKRAAIPITDTGYRSHFIGTLELINAGGPVTLVTAWLDREAKSKKWIACELREAQGDLFAPRSRPRKGAA